MKSSRYKSLEERLLWNSYLEIETECWIWLGKISNGYPMLTMRLPGRKSPVNRRAHRIAVLVFRGIEMGEFTGDHICQNTMCINPMHQDVVTRSDNSKRRWERKK